MSSPFFLCPSFSFLRLKSSNSEIWLERRNNFTRSLAVMSMAGYILGATDSPMPCFPSSAPSPFPFLLTSLLPSPRFDLPCRGERGFSRPFDDACLASTRTVCVTPLGVSACQGANNSLPYI